MEKRVLNFKIKLLAFFENLTRKRNAFIIQTKIQNLYTNTNNNLLIF